MTFNPSLLKQARIDAGLTLKQLAAKSSVGFTTIYYLESGRVPGPRTETIRKLADALGIDWVNFFASSSRLNERIPPQPPTAA